MAGLAQIEEFRFFGGSISHEHFSDKSGQRKLPSEPYEALEHNCITEWSKDVTEKYAKRWRRWKTIAEGSEEIQDMQGPSNMR